MSRKVVLDTETTGISPTQGHRIIEIGCIEIVNRQITDQRYQVYLNPERAVDLEALKVHGITNDFLADKPLFQTIANAFLAFIKGAELIIHNAPFDVGFINHEFTLLRPPLDPVETYCRIFDTLTYARKKHLGQRNNLDALCRRYKIDNSNRHLHGALLDAELLAQIYLYMTGGQTSMDLETANESMSYHAGVNVSSTAEVAHQLRVIKASKEELAQHEKKMRIIKEISGKLSVWERLESTSLEQGE